jgi:phage shock protein PspC (stress-responsive transcriptional regulator)
MKKTVNVNLNGRVFTIDEDAYQLLENYLHNLKIHFRKEESSDEIIADFEARIEELFSEKIRKGYDVIDISYVEDVIARVGKPSDFSENESEVENEDKNKADDFGKQPINQEYNKVKKKLFRDSENKILGGVCSGLSAYFGWDSLPLRIVFLILIFVSSLWLIPVYLLAWLIVPEARTAEEKLRMQGKPVTVENIGKTVASDAERFSERQSGLAQTSSVILKICLAVLFCVFVVPLLFVIILVIILLFALLFGFGDGFINFLPEIGDAEIGPIFSFLSNSMAATFSILILSIVLCVAFIFGIIACFSKSKPVNKGIKWTIIIILILAFILFFWSMFKINRPYKFLNWDWEIQSTEWNGNTYQTINGNGIQAEKDYFFSEPVKSIRTKNLSVQLQIEQTDSIEGSMTLIGDENLIDKIEHRIDNNQLYLSTGQYRFRSIGNPLVIRVRTAELKKITSNSTGNIYIPNAFKADDFKIKLNDAGKFQADSLDVQSLVVDSEGVGSVILTGIARKADFKLDGVGSINALELVSDTVYANVGGVGSIKCNPKDYLKGKVTGVGNLTYKEEPRVKNTVTSGIGKIGKIGKE